jgi:hypothetical protein
MTTTLTIELPDELAENLQTQAERLQVSVSTLVVKSLTDTLSNHNSPISMEPVQNEPQTKDCSTETSDINTSEEVKNLLTLMRIAHLEKRTTFDAPVSQFALFLLPILKGEGSVSQFEIIHDETTAKLQIQMNPGYNSPLNSDNFDNSTLPEVLKPITQDLNSDDPDTCLKAVKKLGEMLNVSA